MGPKHVRRDDSLVIQESVPYSQLSAPPF
jgi:hypothetical protein